jgi:hypothetical protein
MMKQIRVYYDNGINAFLDTQAFNIAKKYDAKLIGSGCWLQAPFTRDLEWRVADDKAPAMRAALQKAGLKLGGNDGC